MDLGLKGKVAIVTGAGRHIGRQIALTLAQEGARVVVNDYYEERAKEVAEEIEAAGGEAMGVRADVTNAEEVNELVKKVIDKYGRVDILVNNAGIMPMEAGAQPTGLLTFAEMDRKAWDDSFDVCMYGAMNCTREVIEGMINQKYGKILNILSDAGRVGEPRMTAYSAAKAGIGGFTKALAKEVGRYCINVNCVSLGATPSPSTEALIPTEQREERMKATLRVYPMGRGLERLGEPSDAANAVAFLVSDAAAWITGQILSVSGGYSMM